MRPIHRTLAGLAIAAILLPILIGVLACLPVPIGDPERSRVDPQMSGVWFDVNAEFLWVIQPYDRRSFLITVYPLELEDCIDRFPEEPADDEETQPGNDQSEDVTADSSAAAEREAAGDSAPNLENLEEVIISDRRYYRPDRYDGDIDADAALAWYRDFIIAVRQDCEAVAVHREAYKSWLTRLGGRDFITMGITGGFDKRADSSPAYWLVWRISGLSSSSMVLEPVDGEFPEFKGLEETRQAYERVIRRHANDPELTNDGLLLIRVPLHDLEYFYSALDPEPGAILTG